MARIQHLVLLCAGLAAFSFAAHAAEDSRPGISYLHTNDDKPVESPVLHLRTIKQGSEAAEEQESDMEKKGTPESRVWKKYRTLAAGTAAEEEEAGSEAEARTDKADALPDVQGDSPGEKTAKASEKTPDAEEKKTGFAVLMEQYHKNREQRRQMRSLQVTAPEEQP